MNPDVELPSDSIPAETARLLTPQSVMRAGLFSIPILALLPLLLYITAGYGGHDFKYHATAWLELHDAWSAHEWRFGWSPWAHYGFGEPSFCFYPPLSLVIGAGLSFLTPFRFVPGVVVWLLLITSGLSMYKAAGLFVPQQYRLPAALLYMFNPYLLMTVVIRFAIAEAWSQALLPLVFLYFYVLIAENRLPVLLVSASLLAAGWLSNISAAIGTFYGFGFLAILIAIQRRSIRPLLLAALTQLCGILLAAFRLLPTFAEKSWVSSQSLLIYDFRSSMQLKRVPPPHLMVYLAGVYIALSLALMFPAVRGIVRRDRHWRTPILALLAIAGFAVCFQLPVTTPLWLLLPQFKFILFPYRLLPLLSLGSLLLIYSEGVSRKLRRVAVITLAVFALFPFFCYGRILPSQRFRSIAAAAASWRTGFEGVREYVPVTVPLALAEPPFELLLSRQGPFASASCAPSILASHPDQRILRTTSATPCTLLIRTYYYPFWHAHLENGTSLPIAPTSNGLIQISVPQGSHQVVLSFVPATGTRTMATAISLITAFILLLGSWFTHRRRALIPIPGEAVPQAQEPLRIGSYPDRLELARAVSRDHKQEALDLLAHAPRQRPVRTSLIFACIVAAFCTWVLSLPLFPSQDGPMHRYYVHVLGAVLSHNPLYGTYQIRHPFPPYATHYLSLLLLYKLFSYDLAEKIFTCGLLILFAYGFRFCARAIGPLGERISLCIAPLFLHWAVMMGFFNYDLALAFFLFAIGFWLRAMAGSRWSWVGYAAMVAILAVTHPVPLLVLIGLFLVHLLLTLLRPAAAASGTFLQRQGWQLAALAFACAAFLYPAASLDRSSSASTLHDMRLHPELARTALLLTGVSPYNTRSASLLINLYRLSLYAMLAVALVLAVRAFAAKWRERRLALGDSLFVSTVLLLVGLPVLPDTVNGSYYFATRLIVLVWVGAMLAASGYLPGRGDRRVIFASAAIFLAALSLVTAEVYVRPVARAVYAVEQQSLPEHGRAILLVGKGLDTWSRFGTQLAPDFFEWGQILPVVRRQDVALDTPWLEQNILPLQAVAGGSLFVGDIRHSPFLNPAMTAPGAVPDAEVDKTVSTADFILYAGAPADLASGLSARLPAGDAARFPCTAHGWYLLCPRRSDVIQGPH